MPFFNFVLLTPSASVYCPYVCQQKSVLQGFKKDFIQPENLRKKTAKEAVLVLIVHFCCLEKRQTQQTATGAYKKVASYIANCRPFSTTVCGYQ